MSVVKKKRERKYNDIYRETKLPPNGSGWGAEIEPWFLNKWGESCGSIGKGCWISERFLLLDPSHLKLIPSAKLVNKQLQNTSVNLNCYTNFALFIKINFAK